MVEVWIPVPSPLDPSSPMAPAPHSPKDIFLLKSREWMFYGRGGWRAIEEKWPKALGGAGYMLEIFVNPFSYFHHYI